MRRSTSRVDRADSGRLGRFRGRQQQGHSRGGHRRTGERDQRPAGRRRRGQGRHGCGTEGTADSVADGVPSLTATAAPLLGADDGRQPGAETASEQRTAGTRQGDQQTDRQHGQPTDTEGPGRQQDAVPGHRCGKHLPGVAQPVERPGQDRTQYVGSGESGDQEAADQHRPIQSAGGIDAEQQQPDAGSGIRAPSEHGGDQVTDQATMSRSQHQQLPPSPV